MCNSSIDLSLKSKFVYFSINDREENEKRKTHSVFFFFFFLKLEPASAADVEENYELLCIMRLRQNNKANLLGLHSMPHCYMTVPKRITFSLETLRKQHFQ